MPAVIVPLELQPKLVGFQFFFSVSHYHSQHFRSIDDYSVFALHGFQLSQFFLARVLLSYLSDFCHHILLSVRLVTAYNPFIDAPLVRSSTHTHSHLLPQKPPPIGHPEATRPDPPKSRTKQFLKVVFFSFFVSAFLDFMWSLGTLPDGKKISNFLN